MAGLSRSEYLASKQKKKGIWLKLFAQVVFLAVMLIVFPMLLLFALPFVIGFAVIIGVIKDGIDLPEFK